MAPATFSNTGGSVGSPAENPVGTIRTAGGQVLAAANLIQYHTEQTENVRANGLKNPLPTADGSNRYGFVAANLVEYFGNGRPLDISEPMHTATSHDREALTAAHVAEFKGQDIGQKIQRPLRTVTAQGGTFGLCGTGIRTYEDGADFGHWPEIRELLNRYCGYQLKSNEIILLTIGGKDWFLYDISMRMLTPRELYSAMGFPPDYKIDRDYTGKPYPKNQQVARCGNAVCPAMAEALVRANVPEMCGKTYQTMTELTDDIAV